MAARTKQFSEFNTAERAVAETLRKDRPLTISTANQIAVAYGAPNAHTGFFILDRLSLVGIAEEGPDGWIRGDAWMKAAAQFGWSLDKPLLEVLPDTRGAVEQNEEGGE